MKKALVVLSSLILATVSSALPTGQIDLSTTGGTAGNPKGYFQIDGANIADGSYAEIVLLQSVSAPTWENTLTVYDSVTIARYSGDGLGSLSVGYKSDGTQTTYDSNIGATWSFTNPEYDDGDYWVAIRVFNNVNKTLASKYAISSFQQINLTMGEPPSQGTQVVQWLPPRTVSYDIPAVPEPATLALFGLGGLALVLRKKMRKEV